MMDGEETMPRDGDELAGPRFFGRMTASVSHEIKNVLAIINENAGLLEDLSLLAQQGGSPAPERLRRIAAALQAQVRRADGLVRHLNQFAHSTDEDESEVSLAVLLELMLALAARFAANRGVRLDFHGGEGAGRLRTRPFLLQRLVWLCLEHAMAGVDTAKAVRVTLESLPGQWRICFSGLRTQAAEAGFPGSAALDLARSLTADLTVEAARGTMAITLPG